MIPEILTGQKNETEWKERRKEILQLFEKYVYGKTPEIIFDKTAHSNPLRLELKENIVYETHRLFFQKGTRLCSLRFEIFCPSKVTGAMPSLMMIDVFDTSEVGTLDPEFLATSTGRLPYKTLIDNGFAAVFIHTNDICNDYRYQYDRGIMEIAPRTEKDSWGAIGAWAWATSRVVDYLYTDERFAKDKISVLGVSRAGKTALWCGAQDERIAAVIPVVSGCGGTAMHRGNRGEQIADMTRVFPFWTCENYADFADRVDELPVDQHMLLALCAPRPLYLSDASEDAWADPEKSFEAAVRASEVYELLGKKGLSGNTFPDNNVPLSSGDIAYHVREGKHGITMYDWEQYILFLKRYFD